MLTRWLGESKVVGNDGRPLVLYHGTSEDFDAFDLSHSFDGGFHFGTKEAANARNDFWLEGGCNDANFLIMPVYLRIENPKQLDFDPFDEESWAEEIAKAKDEGFDGIRYPNRIEGGESWVIFEPRQVKSAIGNCGRFDPDSESLTDSDNFTPKTRTKGLQP